MDLRLPGRGRSGPRHLRGPVPQVQADGLALRGLPRRACGAALRLRITEGKQDGAAPPLAAPSASRSALTFAAPGPPSQHPSRRGVGRGRATTIGEDAPTQPRRAPRAVAPLQPCFPSVMLSAQRSAASATRTTTTKNNEPLVRLGT